MQANEYEVLMILMGECRSRLGNYEGGLDDELRLLKNKVFGLSVFHSWSNWHARDRHDT